MLDDNSTRDLDRDSIDNQQKLQGDITCIYVAYTALD